MIDTRWEARAVRFEEAEEYLKDGWEPISAVMGHMAPTEATLYLIIRREVLVGLD